MFDIGEDQETPAIKQLSVFLPNRVGALLLLTRQLEKHEVHIKAISILDAADHAVVRLVVDQPTFAMTVLTHEGYKLFDTDLLAVRLPKVKHGGIRKMLSALIMAELNVDYIYPVLVRHEGDPVLALHVADIHSASRALRDQGFELLNQDDLGPPDPGQPELEDPL